MSCQCLLHICSQQYKPCCLAFPFFEYIFSTMIYFFCQHQRPPTLLLPGCSNFKLNQNRILLLYFPRACVFLSPSGESMKLASGEFAEDPCSSMKRGNMVRAARALLSAVTHLLVLADMSDVYKLLLQLKLVSPSPALWEQRSPLCRCCCSVCLSSLATSVIGPCVNGSLYGQN